MTATALPADYFKSLKARKVQVESNLQEQWEALVITVANGEPPEPDALLDILESLHKTPEQLEAAVKKLQRCRVLQQKVREAEAAQAEIPELNKKLVEEGERFAKLEDEHGKIMGPLHGRLEWIRQLKWTSDMNYRGELERLSIGCSLAKTIAANSTKVGELRQRMAALGEQLDDLGLKFRQAKGEHNAPQATHGAATNSSEHPQDIVHRSREATQLEGQIAAGRTEWGNLKDQVARLEEENQNLSARMLTDDLVAV